VCSSDLILSAAPAIGKVPGSAEFAARYTAKHGPINNYAASSYDSARIVMAAIDEAAATKKGLPSRTEVLAAMKATRFQGIAYARPAQWNSKGDNVAWACRMRPWRIGVAISSGSCRGCSKPA
jgi:branched-chain amino acid transport system substrate-binding protein